MRALLFAVPCPWAFACLWGWDVRYGRAPGSLESREPSGEWRAAGSRDAHERDEKRVRPWPARRRTWCARVIPACARSGQKLRCGVLSRAGLGCRCAGPRLPFAEGREGSAVAGGHDVTYRLASYGRPLCGCIWESSAFGHMHIVYLFSRDFILFSLLLLLSRSFFLGWLCASARLVPGSSTRILTPVHPPNHSELKREKTWSRIHLVPLLLAEGDRDTYRREQAALEREREIMRDVEGWEVSGRLWVSDAVLIPGDVLGWQVGVP